MPRKTSRAPYAKQVRTIAVRDEPVSFKVPSDLLDTMRAVATARGVSVSQLVRAAVMHDIERCPTCGQRTRVDKAARAARAA